jgi:hypothetical protein
MSQTFFACLDPFPRRCGLFPPSLRMLWRRLVGESTRHRERKFYLHFEAFRFHEALLLQTRKCKRNIVMMERLTIFSISSPYGHLLCQERWQQAPCWHINNPKIVRLPFLHVHRAGFQSCGGREHSSLWRYQPECSLNGKNFTK